VLLGITLFLRHWNRVDVRCGVFGFRQDIIAGRARPKILGDDEGNRDCVLDLRMDTWLLEDGFQENKGLDSAANRAAGDTGFDLACSQGEFTVN